MRVPASAVVVLLLAGCTSGNPDPASVPLPPQQPENPPIQWFGLHVTDTVVAGLAEPGGWVSANCVALEGWGRLTRAVVKAAWQAPAFAPKLELLVMDAQETVLALVAGSDSAQLELNEVWLNGRGANQLFIGVQVPQDATFAATFNTDVDLTIQAWFEPVEGDLSFDGGWGCGTEA